MYKPAAVVPAPDHHWAKSELVVELEIAEMVKYIFLQSDIRPLGMHDNVDRSHTWSVSGRRNDNEGEQKTHV